MNGRDGADGDTVLLVDRLVYGLVVKFVDFNLEAHPAGTQSALSQRAGNSPLHSRRVFDCGQAIRGEPG